MKKRNLILVLMLLFYPAIIFSQTDDKFGLNKLMEAGTISVTIGGDFVINGTFPALITERADAFITRLYNDAKEKSLRLVTDTKLLPKVINEFENYSLRDIRLKRSSGEEIRIDLLRFRNDGDFKNNPYLKNDDVIIFPPFDIERNFFTVEGAVNNPGKFFFVDGDNLQDALELARGIHQAYENVNHIVIYRLSYDGLTMEILNENLSSTISLQRGDRIVVVADETQKKEFSVLVVGEVNLPGKIPITRNNTTLKSIIERAGGLKETANLKNARLYSGNSAKLLLELQFGFKIEENPELVDPELDEKFISFEHMLMYRMSDVTEEDSAYFTIENQLRILNEGTSFNLLDIKNPESEASNYIVHDGDILLIPQKKKSVFVFGQVKRPGHIEFKENAGYKYYIEKAGGLGEYASDDIKIIKGDTRDWISANEEIKIEEGDYIWILKDPVRSFNYHLNRIGTYLGIVGSIATIILLLIQLGK
jgi:protein involved in polysaccharide export with SLBB domain